MSDKILRIIAERLSAAIDKNNPDRFDPEFVASDILEELNISGCVIIETKLSTSDHITLNQGEADENLIKFDGNFLNDLLIDSSNNVIDLSMLSSQYNQFDCMNLDVISLDQCTINSSEKVDSHFDSHKDFQQKLDKLKIDVENLIDLSKKMFFGFQFSLDKPEKV